MLLFITTGTHSRLLLHSALYGGFLVRYRSPYTVCMQALMLYLLQSTSVGLQAAIESWKDVQLQIVLKDPEGQDDPQASKDKDRNAEYLWASDTSTAYELAGSDEATECCSFEGCFTILPRSIDSVQLWTSQRHTQTERAQNENKSESSQSVSGSLWSEEYATSMTWRSTAEDLYPANWEVVLEWNECITQWLIPSTRQSDPEYLALLKVR